MPKEKDISALHRYKMSDLVSATGYRRETIHFYINEGLLPAPKKTSRNMAWYSDEHIELLNKIRTLQQEQFLPLKAIKTILHDAPDYKFSNKQAEFLSAIRERIDHRDEDKAGRHKRGSVRRVTDSDRIELQEMGWIDHSEPPYSDMDKKVMRLWDRFLDQGIADVPGVGPAAFDYLLKAVDDLLEGNIEFYREFLSGIDQEKAASLAVNAIPVFTELVSLLYEKRLTKFAENFSDKKSVRKKK